MNQSVVAVFENQDEAERAREEIIASGISPQRVTLHAGEQSSDTDVRTAPGTQIDTETGIGHFFRSLFGLEDDRPARYEEAARRGHATLVVDCERDDEIERLRTIMDRYDVVDIDERATAWSPDSEEGRRAMSGQAAGAASTRATADTDAETRIPVVEENLAVG